MCWLEGGTSVTITPGEQGVSATSPPRGAGPHFQINIQKCPDCKQATLQASTGEKEMAPAEIERIECDAIIMQSGRRARSAIPPKNLRETPGLGVEDLIHPIVCRRLLSDSRLEN